MGSGRRAREVRLWGDVDCYRVEGTLWLDFACVAEVRGIHLEKSLSRRFQLRAWSRP